MKLKLLLATLLCSIAFAHAQNARTILDKANEAFINAGGIKATFLLNSEDKGQKITYTQDGTIYIKGNKFKIDVPDGITWFDGKTQWSYIKGSDEVNVSNPSGDELAGISPSVLLNIYKKGFKLNYKGEATENGKKVYIVELIPESNKADFLKLIIKLNKADYLFTSIILYQKDGVVNTLRMKQIQTKVNLPDNTFIFNKASYPNVEVIDLR